jgi:hypothetical protein
MKRALLAFVFSLCCLAQAQAAFTVTSEGTSTLSGSGTFSVGPFDPGAGATVYVVVTGGAGSPSDGTNTYSSINEVIFDSGLSFVGSYYHYYSSDPGNITVTCPAPGSGGAMSVTVITGSNGTIDFAASNSNSGLSNSPTVTSNAATEPGELFIATVSFLAPSSEFTQTSGWSAPPNSAQGGTGAGISIYSGNQLNSGTGALTYGGSASLGTTAAWGAIIDALKPSSVVTKKCTLTLMGAGPC